MSTYDVLDQGIQRIATELETLAPRLPELYGSELAKLGKHARTLSALACEAAEDEADQPGHATLLMDILGEIQRSAVREWDLTPDEAGVAAAKIALGEMAPALAPQPGDRASRRDDLLEAVRAQDATVTLELYGGARSDRVSKTIENYPVPRIPVVGDEFLLDDGSLARVVVPVRLVGRAAIVRAQVWATLPDSEKF